jgi:hypothetical protein
MLNFKMQFNPFLKCKQQIIRRRHHLLIKQSSSSSSSNKTIKLMPKCYLLSSKFMLTCACMCIIVYFLIMDIILYSKVKQRGPLTQTQFTNFTNKSSSSSSSSSSSFWSPLTIMIVDATHYNARP